MSKSFPDRWISDVEAGYYFCPRWVQNILSVGMTVLALLLFPLFMLLSLPFWILGRRG